LDILLREVAGAHPAVPASPNAWRAEAPNLPTISTWASRTRNLSCAELCTALKRS
jgi:hypothetical protein